MVRHGQSIANMQSRFAGHSDFDLSELGHEQARLAGEAQEIEYKLKYGEVVKVVNADVIQVGSKVTYLDLEENCEYTFAIVGTAEANISQGKISNESPIGKALYGHKAGDVVTVIKPRGGKYDIEIKSVEVN